MRAKMKVTSLGEYIWGAVFIIMLAVVMAYTWIGHSLDILSPLPVTLPVTMLVAPLCGAAVYLFVRSIRPAFYITIGMCMVACLITGVFFLLPAYQGLIDFQMSLHISVKFIVVMGLYVFPFSMGGCWVAAWIFPE